MLNNPKLDIVSINDYAIFGQNPLINSQDIAQKQNSDVIQGQYFYNKLTKMDI